MTSPNTALYRRQAVHINQCIFDGIPNFLVNPSLNNLQSTLQTLEMGCFPSTPNPLPKTMSGSNNNCTNCKGCTSSPYPISVPPTNTKTLGHSCNSCKDCTGCHSCTSCTSCVACHSCTSCEDCEQCHSCTNCDSCVDCHSCNNCTDCVGCRNCTNCSGLKNARNLNGVHK
jgi:hypothetical protein